MAAGSSDVGPDFVDRLLFPAPRSEYTSDDWPGELIWLPRGLSPTGGASEDHVPALLLLASSSKHFVLAMHSNGDDLGRFYWFCHRLRNTCSVHVLAVEYPGYGVAPGRQATSESVTENAMLGFRFLTEAPRLRALPRLPLPLGIAIGARLRGPSGGSRHREVPERGAREARDRADVVDTREEGLHGVVEARGGDVRRVRQPQADGRAGVHVAQHEPARESCVLRDAVSGVLPRAAAGVQGGARARVGLPSTGTPTRRHSLANAVVLLHRFLFGEDLRGDGRVRRGRGPRRVGHDRPGPEREDCGWRDVRPHGGQVGCDPRDRQRPYRAVDVAQ
mmetsp:Transcript_14532/g.41992  ORF Transcript_14532/g.41992 Transcript_14532/m.41992 type:complete len:334 (+) Transcript_14532:48-1049(+)